MDKQSLKIKRSRFSVNDFFSNKARYLKAGFWYWDSLTNSIYLNKKILLALNANAEGESIYFNDFIKTVHPDDAEKLNKVFKRLKGGKDSEKEFEVRFLIYNQWRWTRIFTAIGELDENEKVKNIVGRFVQIDTRRYVDVQDAQNENLTIDVSSFRFDTKNETFAWFFPPNDSIKNAMESDSFFSLESFSKILVPSDFKRFTNQWNKFLISDSIVFTCTLSLTLAKKGVEVIFFVNKQVGSSYINGAIVNVEDFTRQKITEKQSKIIESVFKQHKLPLMVFTGEGTLKTCNKHAEKLFGYSIQQLKDTNVFKSLFSIHPECYEKLMQFIRYRASDNYTCKIKTSEDIAKTTVWIPSVIADISSDVFVAVRDVSEFEDLQQRYKNVSHRYDVIMQYVDSLQGITKPESFFSIIGQMLEKDFPKTLTVVFSVNPVNNFLMIEGVYGVGYKAWEAFVSNLGWNPVGRRFILKDSHAEILKNYYGTVVESDSTDIIDEYILATNRKMIEKVFDIQKYYLSPFIADSKIYGGIIFIPTGNADQPDKLLIADITKICLNFLVRLEHINAQYKQVDQLNTRLEELSDRIALLSHEFRTPLNSILGFSQLLEVSNLANDNQHRYVQIINSKGQSLLRLINDVMDLTRLERGNFTVVKSHFDLNKILFQVFENYAKQLELLDLKPYELKLNLPENRGMVEIFTDEGRLEQVLSNVFDTILKRFDNGYIELGHVLQEGKIKIYIKETVFGVDAKVIGHIFDRLSNIENMAPTDFTKVNLKLSKDIVVLLNGSFEVEFIEPHTISFNITFPTENANYLSMGGTSGNEFSISRIDLKNRVILVADDEELNYIILKELLEEWGATVLWVKNGKDVVALVQSMNPKIDAILMDIRMPVMDGYAATMEVKHINPNIPVIAQTAYAAEEDRLKANAAGCNDYITKPIDPEQLAKILLKNIH